MAKKERNLKKMGLTKKTTVKSAPKKKKTEKKKITPKKKPEVKKKKEIKKVTVKEKKTKEKISKKGQKAAVTVVKPKPLPELQEPYVNLRCRHCYLVDGYAKTEKVCHHCGAEIYEIDII